MDLRPPITSLEDLQVKSFYSFLIEEYHRNEGFLKDSLVQQEGSYSRCSVKPEIVDFFLRACKDTSKSSWETDIEDFARKLARDDAQEYDLISYNNVHGHIVTKTKNQILPNLLTRLKVGGYLITDSGGMDAVKYHPGDSLQSRFRLTEVNPGIYKRLG